MNIRSTLTRADYENYLVYLYFGPDQDLLKACINRAYRDFNRTMHGFSKIEKVGQLYDEAAILLKELLESLKTLSSPNSITTEVFDNWHKTTCEKITSLFLEKVFIFLLGRLKNGSTSIF